MAVENPVCPECDGPIGTTSTFCMHCGADLEDRRVPTSEGADGASQTDDVWLETTALDVDLDAAQASRSEATAHQQDLPPAYRSSSGAVDRTKLLPEGFAIKAATFVLAIAAGTAVGITSMYLLSGVVAGWLAFLIGVVLWFGATAALLRVVPG